MTKTGAVGARLLKNLASIFFAQFLTIVLQTQIK